MAPMRDIWQSTRAYERYIGRWSRKVAQQFVVELPVLDGGTWVDVGCGSGALTAAVLASRRPAAVVALDRSVDFVTQSRDRPAHGRVAFVAGDAAQLPFRDGAIDAIVSGLVLNFVPQPQLAAREMLRCITANGFVAVYVWDYAEGMQLIRLFWDAATEIDPAAAQFDEGKRFPLCRPKALEELFLDSGASGVTVSAITVETQFTGYEDLWSPFLGGQGPAPTYVSGLTEEQRARLKDELRERVSEAADGSITLAARAWVARASK